MPKVGPDAALALGRSVTPVQEHAPVHIDHLTDDGDKQAADYQRLVSIGRVRVDRDVYPEDPDNFVPAAVWSKPVTTLVRGTGNCYLAGWH